MRFSKDSNGSLLNKTLVEDGLSSVRALLDSGHEGIYTLTDSSKIDEVLGQMEIRLEMAKCWVNLYLMKMVTQVIILKC
jgi:hypothetical protein